MRRITIVVAVALMAVASITTPALAGEPEYDNPTHVALGDSVAAGVGATNPERLGYVPRLNRVLRWVECFSGNRDACRGFDLSDYSVGGAKSGDLIADQLPAALAEIAAREGDTDDGNDVEHITITIGGNDVFQPVIGACGAGVTPECVATIQTVFTDYQANLAPILGTLRFAAPDAEIAVMTYYNPIGSCELAALAPLADTVLEGDGALLAGGLNDIIRGVAAQVPDITVVETYGKLRPRDFVGGEDCLHPDNSGHRKIARQFLRALI